MMNKNFTEQNQARLIKSVKSFLDTEHLLRRMRSAYIIYTDNEKKALLDIESFLPSLFRSNQGNLSNNTDYHIIESSGLQITIEKIRELKSFLYKTPLFMEYNIAVLLNADNMNINAANCCLKILEETPENSFIFLVTTNIDKIIDTILSRCIKIHCFYDRCNVSFIDPLCSKMLLKNTKIEDRILFIKKCTTTNNELWNNFTDNVLTILHKFCKKSLNYQNNIEFDEIESKIWEQFPEKSLHSFEKKYKEVDEIIRNTKEFNLDIWTSYILILKHFESL